MALSAKASNKTKARSKSLGKGAAATAGTKATSKETVKSKIKTPGSEKASKATVKVRAKKARAKTTTEGRSSRTERTQVRGVASTGDVANGVKIKMYNVGFGDSFLVTIPGGEQDRATRMLFDCGSIEAATVQSMSNVVSQIIDDAKDSDGIPRISVVVCTHRHKDHVSGFGDKSWQSVEVGEVWMPWTEDPNNPAARKIRNAQSQLALALQARLAAGAVDAITRDRIQGIVDNALSLSNESAMRTLHSGFTGRPVRRFLPTPKRSESSFETDALPGIRIHVLGPSRDPDIIRDMDPPKGESYLMLSTQVPANTEGYPAPFSKEHEADGSMYSDIASKDLQDIQSASSLDDLGVAVALDKAVNGTSLMIVVEISGTFLLFPGDAQWGTWQAALADDEWRDILSKISFYKIGHHGSHNATPKEFVEDVVGEGIWAMASTKTRKCWPEIPKMELISALRHKHAKIARSDKGKLATDFDEHTDTVVELEIPI